MSEIRNRPAPFSTDGSNPFAHRTMKVRVPKIVEEVQRLNPDYPPQVQRALEVLRVGLETDALIPMLNLPAPDYDEWAAIYRPGDTWLHTEWFYAEITLYRHIIQAVRWWETGRDPFAPKKIEEIEGSALWKFLDTVLTHEPANVEDRLLALVQTMLWGNRIDLSFAASLAHGSTWNSEDLIADDSALAVEHLLRQRGMVHILADNTGTELAADLAFIDALLDTHLAERVIYHVKMYPTFVSDSTVEDARLFLDRLKARGGPAHALAERLRAAMNDGRLRLAPDLYWNLPRWLWDAPARLSQLFEQAALVIVKGDLNYRRATGDAIWPEDTTFAQAVDYFPAPLLALRTLKSDGLVGLRPGLADELDRVDPEWRVNGRRGVIQFAPK